MTAESGQREKTRAIETKIQRVVEEEKRPLKIEGVLSRLVQLSEGSRGLPQISGPIKDYDLNELKPPKRFIPGYVRTGKFEDGLWLRASTTDENLVHIVHNLYVFNDGTLPQYNVTDIDTYLSNGPNGDITGSEDMATTPHVSDDLHSIAMAYEIEAAGGWKRTLSPGDLRFIRKP